MPNNFTSKTDAELVALAQNLVSKIPGGATPNPFNITAAQITGTNTAVTSVTGAMANQAAAMTSYKSATVARGVGKTSLVGALNAIVATAAASAATDAQLVSIGLAPRRTTPSRPAAPLPVEGLSALPYANGTVRLGWKRGGNRPSAVFVVEASTDGLSWGAVHSGTRTGATLEGFAPGAATWFRVRATNGVGESAPSAAASIYAPSAPAAMQLRVA